MKNRKSRAAAVIRNVVETPWKQYPGHFGGALSKPLVRPETAGSRLVDYRISTYQPMAYVETHTHKVQEQIYHVLEGEGSMEIAGKRQIVRRHDVIFIPPGVPHSICNNGIADLTFIVVTTPVEDR
jgi:mannose-6-phosphate isomerase-like protein (cupin superfamily)